MKSYDSLQKPNSATVRCHLNLRPFESAQLHSMRRLGECLGAAIQCGSFNSNCVLNLPFDGSTLPFIPVVERLYKFGNLGETETGFTTGADQRQPLQAYTNRMSR